MLRCCAAARAFPRSRDAIAAIRTLLAFCIGPITRSRPIFAVESMPQVTGLDRSVSGIRTAAPELAIKESSRPLPPAGVNEIAVTGAHSGVVGREEENHGSDVLGLDPILETL